MNNGVFLASALAKIAQYRFHIAMRQQIDQIVDKGGKGFVIQFDAGYFGKKAT